MDKETIEPKESGAISTRQRQLTGWSAQLVRLIAVGMSLFQLYTGYFQFTAMNQRVPHVCLGYILIFLVYPLGKKSRKDRLSIDSITAAAVILICGVYVMFTWFRKMGAMGLEVPLYELIMGGIFIILLIEGTRRALGLAFPMIAILVLVYARFGEIMPSLFAHKNYGVDRIISSMFITADGVFGMLAGISATFIFLFILFGAMLREAGGGEFFINFAYGICGRFRGGPAKIAVVASSMFGMLSGSGTANVAGTGQITIPLMKRTGYPPYFLQKYGRLYDIGLAMEYYPAREGGKKVSGIIAMMKDYKDFGKRMFFKGKMGPLGGGSPFKGMRPSKIKKTEVMKKIFEKVEEK